mmetsp:Transcript_21081/g.51579  ORF Transcript_21081/g.51579 Transcript_21081/m.51579 type:complete len:243 (-) Transcript_21081:157-885(-)
MKLVLFMALGLCVATPCFTPRSAFGVAGRPHLAAPRNSLPASFPRSAYSISSPLLRLSSSGLVSRKRTRSTHVARAQWLNSKASVQVPLPVEECWGMWLRREAIPQWMPWVSSVEIDNEDRDVSRWVLSTEQLGQKFEFSWKAKNLPPLKHKMIHWRSIDGSMGGSGIGSMLQVKNRGAVKFRKLSSNSCEIQLVISYEMPDVLAPIIQQISPLVQPILQADMDRFRDLATQGKLEIFDEMV